MESTYEKQDGIYSCGNLIVAPNPPEAILAEAYLRFAREDLLGQIFYQGPVPSLMWFLGEYRKPGNCTLACYRRVGDRAELQGLGWLNQVVHCGDNYTRGEVGTAFFRTTGIRAIKFGQMMFDWFFENRAIDVAYGMTPVPNAPAWKYAKALGMTLAGPIPNFASWKGDLCGVWISSLSRKDWALTR